MARSRSLPEQFAIATFVLLTPVAIVMVVAGNAVFRTQVEQVTEEAQKFAHTITAYIDATKPSKPSDIFPFLNSLSALPGTKIEFRTPNEKVIDRYEYESPGPQDLAYGRANSHSPDWLVSVGMPTSVAWQRSMQAYRVTITISGGATVLLVIVQFVYVRRLLRALRALERSSAAVGAGDLNARFDDARMPSLELEHVRDAFHDMVDKLRAAREEIDRQMEEERRMNMTLKSLQQQVIRQERLAAIGVLVSGIAHELNNPLQTIAGISDLLQRDPAVTAERKADLALVYQESERASGIIRNLSRFGRQQETKPVPVSLVELLKSVIELRQRRLAEQGIQLDRDEHATRSAYAVFTELQQVVLNFVINAEHAVRSQPPSRRRIILRTRDVDNGVCLEVEDSGAGVPLEDEAKLFQPFFTTKPVGEGTGLGLSVSYGIIQSLGGEIGYRRGDMGGALFYFTVPIVREFSS